MKVVFDTEKLKQILKDYSQITGLRIGIYDPEFNEIGAYPLEHCLFCQLIREHTTGYHLCKSCDALAYKETNHSNNIHVYKCHAGLIEATAPIKDHDTLIGYIMIGQMLYDTSITDQWEATLTDCLSLPLDTLALKSAFFELPRLSPSKIESTARIMQACAAYIWLDQLIKIQRDPISLQIEKYIDAHLATPISLKDIAHSLSIGRTTLCQSAKDAFNMTIIEMVRLRRIEKAKQLLKNTRDPIATIAYNVGIPDYNYFSRTFKQVVGLSPKDYRKKQNLK